MQWSSGKNAGFTSGTPWLKVNPNYSAINVEAQENDPDSVLNYYRRLTALRKSPEYSEVFTYGEFIPAYEDTETIMAYYRADACKRVLVAANFGREAVEVTLDYAIKRVLLTNQAELLVEKTHEAAGLLKLESCQSVVLECG